MTYPITVAGTSPAVAPLPYRRARSSFRLQPALSRAELQRIIAELLG
jgi:hypothetical protein